MIARIIEILSGFIVSHYLSDGLLRRHTLNGHRISLYTAAFRNHHAVLGVPGINRAIESLAVAVAGL